MNDLFSQVKDTFQKDDGLSLVERVFVVAFLVGSIGFFLAYMIYLKPHTESGIVCGPMQGISTSTD